MPVIKMQPIPEHGGPRGRGAEGPFVSPFAQGGLNKSLGFSVRSRSIRSRSDMAQTHELTQRSERARDIARSVVGHHSLNSHVAFGKPGNGTLEKAGCRIAGLVGQDFDVRYARSIVDANVRKLPTDAAIRITATIAGDSMPDSTFNLAQFLDVDMNEFTRLCALITNHRLTRVQAIKPRDTAFFCDSRNGSSATTDFRSDPIVSPTLAAQALDARLQFISHRCRHSSGTRRSVGQAGVALKTVSLDPFKDRRSRYPQRGSDIVRGFPLLESSHNRQSTTPRQLGVLMAHHATFSQQAADPHLRRGIRNLLREHG